MGEITDYPSMDLPIDDKREFQLSGFDANMPGDVRHCNNIPMGAKVLYTEIRGLTNVHGYCFASNDYFCFQFDCDEKTIKRWIKALEDEGFIQTQKVRNTNNGKLYRIIRIAGSRIASEEKRTKMSEKNGQKCPKKTDKNVRSNTKSINTYSLYKDNKNNGFGANCQGEKTKSFQNFNQRDYDYSLLEAQIVNRPVNTDSEGDTG